MKENRIFCFFQVGIIGDCFLIEGRLYIVNLSFIVSYKYLLLKNLEQTTSSEELCLDLPSRGVMIFDVVYDAVQWSMMVLMFHVVWYRGFDA